MTKIANYSTTVTALKSIGEIQGILVAHGRELLTIAITPTRITRTCRKGWCMDRATSFLVQNEAEDYRPKKGG